MCVEKFFITTNRSMIEKERRCAMPLNLTPEEALRSKSTEFAGSYYDKYKPRYTQTEDSCGTCGGIVICAYAETGIGHDMFHTFVHVCLTSHCTQCVEENDPILIDSPRINHRSDLACPMCGRKPFEMSNS